MSMLRLGHVKFLEGCTGLSLDYAAREPFWKRGLDFNHGTGHGVGYLLNVHERPIGIRYRVVPERQENTPFMPGMVCSDEPGIYIEGSHGIRTENLIYCKKDEKTDYGQFLSFEYLTYVPIDLEASGCISDGRAGSGMAQRVPRTGIRKDRAASGREEAAC